MLLRDGCGLPRPAATIEAAVESALATGLRTADLASPGTAQVSCSGFAKAVEVRLRESPVGASTESGRP